MQKLTKTAFLMTLCLLLTAVSSGADRRFEKKFSVNPGGTFKLTTDVGSVDVKGNSTNEVSVVAELRGRERDVNEFEISAEQTGSGVEVEGRNKRGRGFPFFGFNSSDIEVHYTISVPSQYNLDMKTSGGNLSISAVKGDVRGVTSGGDIRVGNVEGPVEAHTSGGNLRAERITGKLHMETSGGEVEVTNVSGDVDVSTSGGNMRLSDVDGIVRAGTSGGDINVKLRSANKGVYVETSGGNIDLALAKDSGADVDASTSGGDVTCDMPITMSGKINEQRIKGAINGGGATVRARTSGGNIRIYALE